MLCIICPARDDTTGSPQKTPHLMWIVIKESTGLNELDLGKHSCINVPNTHCTVVVNVQSSNNQIVY